MRVLHVLALVATAVLAGPLTVGAETFRLSALDGTIHYTNAPTDPRYQRSGMTPPPAAAPASGPNVPVALSPSATASYSSHIRDAAARYGVSERLVSAVIRVESGFNAKAISRKGARGLMQLMPATATMLGVRDSFDPLENIDGGVRHLRGLIDRFNNVPLALAAYNAGEQAVTQHRGIPPYPETQDYVARILRLMGDEDAPVATAPAPQSTYRVVTDDGTTIYTNIPPRGRR